MVLLIYLRYEHDNHMPKMHKAGDFPLPMGSHDEPICTLNQPLDLITPSSIARSLRSGIITCFELRYIAHQPDSTYGSQYSSRSLSCYSLRWRHRLL